MRQHLSIGLFGLLFSLLAWQSQGLAKEELKGTKIAIETTEVENEVWPQVNAKALIKASPLASAAIFAAYDYQKNYIPNLLESKVTLEKVGAKDNDTHVSYRLEMPWPLGDSKYIHGHKLTSPKEGSYKVSWYMVKSDSAENVQGYALFEPHPGNPKYTLMSYTSLVSPKSFLAGIFKKLMVGDVIKSIEAIRSTTEKLVKVEPKLVKKYQDKIENVLAGNKAYLP
jgi:hypothetical protein